MKLRQKDVKHFLYPGYHQYIDGSNFASAGAGALVETNQGLVCIFYIKCVYIYIHTHVQY